MSSFDTTNERLSFIEDEFENGLDIGTPSSRWVYRNVGPYIASDGIFNGGPSGLTVKSPGVNVQTGTPAFTLTQGQEADANSIPGIIDALKFLVDTNVRASSGYPGIDAVDGEEIMCEAEMAVEAYGIEGHPFGDAVEEVDSDYRLAAAGLFTLDLETYLIFDFLLTNRAIYVLYERLPFGREQLGNYAGFSAVVPVGSRTPGQTHHLGIAYNRTKGVVRWLLDGREVFSVARIGHRIERSYLRIDNGGVDAEARPRQLICGFGSQTALHHHGPTDRGLVRLTRAEDYYYNPTLGYPVPETFVDESSLLGSRLFGQGVVFRILRFSAQRLRVR